jgi:hypothetical protein
MKNEQDSKSPAIPPLPPAAGSAVCPVCGKTIHLKLVKETHGKIPRFRWHRFAGGMCMGSNEVPPNIVLGQSGAKEKNANAMDKTT